MVFWREHFVSEGVFLFSLSIILPFQMEMFKESDDDLQDPLHFSDSALFEHIILLAYIMPKTSFL
jgi:hypothetical protein